MCVEHADAITFSIGDEGSAHSLINCHRRRKLTHSDGTYYSSTPCIKHTDSAISSHVVSHGVSQLCKKGVATLLVHRVRNTNSKHALDTLIHRQHYGVHGDAASSENDPALGVKHTYGKATPVGDE